MSFLIVFFLLFSGVLTVLCIVYLWMRYTKRALFTFGSKVGGPHFLPIIGTTYIFLGKNVDCLSAIGYQDTKYPFPSCFWIGHSFHYGTKNAVEIKTVLNHPQCYSKGELYNGFNAFFKNSLLLVPYETWKPRRKYVCKGFKQSTLNTYCPTFYENSCKLVEDLKHFNEQTGDLYYICNYFSFLNFFQTSLGLDKIPPGSEEIADILIEVQDIFGKKMMNPLTPYALWYLFHPDGRIVTKKVNIARTFMKGIIEKKRKQYESYSNDYIENNNVLPLIDLLLNAEGKSLSNEEVFEELTLFSAGATDTTGHTLAFCFTLLGMHPEVQEKVYEEVMSIVGHNDITSENIAKLKYTEAVILESQRILPVIPQIIRHAKEDVDIGTKIIPKGTNILISIIHVHRDEKYWPQPLKYDPTRFLPENINSIEPCSFLPFSAGPRDCIGKTSAMLLLKNAVAVVVRNFKITSNYKSVSEFKLWSCIVMRTTHPLDCHFTQRVEK